MSQIAKSFTLETARCLLHLPSEADIPHVFSATRVTGFNNGMVWEPPQTAAELYAPLAQSIRAWEEGSAYTFTIIAKTVTGKPVTAKQRTTFLGRISIRRSAQAGVWNIGFWTHPEHQRQGYMTETARAVLAFGFDSLGATHIEAYHALWNSASRRVLEAIGMSFAEVIPQGFQKRGVWVEEHRLVMTRGVWACLANR